MSLALIGVVNGSDDLYEILVLLVTRLEDIIDLKLAVSHPTDCLVSYKRSCEIVFRQIALVHIPVINKISNIL